MNGYFENLGIIINLPNVDRIEIEKQGYDEKLPIIFSFLFYSGSVYKITAADLEQASVFLSTILKISVEEAKGKVRSVPVRTSKPLSGVPSEEKKED